MPEVESPGLRERKRAATRQSIQRAALRLALDRGLEHLTIEEISREADVSPRTFFNYFPTKEAALTGDAPALSDESDISLFTNGGPSGDLFLDLGELIAASADDATDSREMMLLRRDLHTRYPHLFALRMAGMKAFEDEVATIIRARLELVDPLLAADPAALDSRARLTTLVAFAALRHAWSCWTDPSVDRNASLAPKLRESFRQLDSLLVQSSPA
ncbi:MAG TPA: TetR family transcriptional regulator [Galbitalea sp.]|jgi:AcrR family transcriptional regulator